MIKEGIKIHQYSRIW